MEEQTIKERNDAWIKDRSVLSGHSGTIAYGLGTDNKKETIKGVYAVPVDYLIGLNSFREHIPVPTHTITQTTNSKIISMNNIGKFVNDCARGSISSLELLFLNEEDYINKSNIGNQLIESRDLFISKNLIEEIINQANVQASIVTKRIGSKFYTMTYGYDIKAASHAVRLLDTLIQILETGTFSTYCNNPLQSILIEIRKGNYDFDKVVKLIRKKGNKVEQLKKTTEFYSELDFKSINELLVNLNLMAIENNIK